MSGRGFRRSAVALIAVPAVVVALQVSSAGATHAAGVTLTVKGVTGYGFVGKKPVVLTMKQLGALQLATVTTKIGGVKVVEKGPPMTELLSKASFFGLAGCDDSNARYWVQATSATDGTAVVMAAAEFDPEGANRLAILSISENGKPLARPRLVVKGDRTDARDLPNVSLITVGRAAPQLFDENEACNLPNFHAPLNTVPDAGGVVINGAVAHPTTLTFAQLKALPQVAQDDTYESHGAPRTRHEQGPSLYSILAAADPTFQSGPKDNLRYYIELTSSADGEPVVVSWGEIDPAYNGTKAILSLAEDGVPILDTDPGPRLTMPGDAGGERYNYGVQVITVFRAPAVSG